MVVPSSDSEDLFEASGAKDKQLDILPLQGTPSVLLGLEGQIIEKIEWVASRAEATGTAPAGTISRLTTTSTAGH